MKVGGVHSRIPRQKALVVPLSTEGARKEEIWRRVTQCHALPSASFNGMDGLQSCCSIPRVSQTLSS
jgi:hypothetical protein